MDNVDITKENETESSYFQTPSRSTPPMETSAEIGSLRIDTEKSDLKNLPPGVVIPTLDAVGWLGHPDADIRPRLTEKSGESRLIDTGAQISATPKRPGDKEDFSIKLVAVNG